MNVHPPFPPSPLFSGELLLLHGWGVGRNAWQPVVDQLSATHPALRLRLIDLPGYGDTPENSDFSAAAHALSQALPVGAVLCGWSLGAQLALRAARLAPDRLAGLVLVGATPCFVQQKDWPDAQAPALLETFAAAVAADPATARQRFIALINKGDTQARPIGRQLAQWLKNSPLPSTPTLLAGLGWLREIDLRGELLAIRTPTLLLHGEQDPLMPLAAADWLAHALPAARLETFPGAAHAPFLNDPDRFAARLADFCHAPA